MPLFTALKHSIVLLSGMLLMIMLWAWGRIPGANLLLVVFTFLASGFLLEVRPFKKRLHLAIAMTVSASAIQFLFSISNGLPFLQVLLAFALTALVFLTIPDFRAGCIVLITGNLAFAAPAGFVPGANRSLDILYGLLIIAVTTALGNTGIPKESPGLVLQKYSPYQAFMRAAELGIGCWIFKVLQLKHGVWVMLTVLFIAMSETTPVQAKRLSFQRIFAIPLGIMFSGFLLGSFCTVDHRLIYLLPFIGAGGFFILYNYGNFFLFSTIFMITLTAVSDWLTGTNSRFNFWESFFSRTAATLLGALIELFLHPHQTTGTGDTV